MGRTVERAYRLLALAEGAADAVRPTLSLKIGAGLFFVAEQGICEVNAHFDFSIMRINILCQIRLVNGILPKERLIAGLCGPK
jgi:hypothetical protein